MAYRGKDFPVFQGTPASPEELGENARWLDPAFVEEWTAAQLAENEARRSHGSDDTNTGKGKGKGKDKGRAGSSKDSSSSSSKKPKSSGKHESSKGGKDRELAAPHNVYETDPNTGALYRYAEGGAVIYFDHDSRREYYLDEYGQAVWL